MTAVVDNYSRSRAVWCRGRGSRVESRILARTERPEVKKCSGDPGVAQRCVARRSKPPITDVLYAGLKSATRWFLAKDELDLVSLGRESPRAGARRQPARAADPPRAIGRVAERDGPRLKRENVIGSSAL